VFRRGEISAALYGVATADALGAPFEFLSPEKIRGPIEMRGGGVMEISPGEWTDDTELTLRLAESLSAEPLPGGPDWEVVARSYIAWADSDPKDIGHTTRAALQGASGFGDAQKRAKRFHRETGRSAGNGTIMRAAPLAFLPVSGAELAPLVRTESSITHYAPEAADAAWVFVCAIRNLLRGKDPLQGTAPETRKIQEAVKNHTNRDYVAGAVSEGGSAWSSLAAALWSLRFADFVEGVSEVIRLGWDTDTNATCAGALLAARGDRPPAAWVSMLHDQERIERAIDGLATNQGGGGSNSFDKVRGL
jgi:ADP-ribosyl-[dinitrogen reductase] hydrolase